MLADLAIVLLLAACLAAAVWGCLTGRNGGEATRIREEAERRGRKAGDYFEDKDTMLPMG